MADESLKLVAEVVDRFTGPLRALRQGIQSIQSTPGVARIQSDLGSATRAVGNLSVALRNTLVPALSAAGLAGFGVGAGLASISSSSAQTTNRLSQLSYQTTVTTQTLRVLSALAPRVGVDESAMLGGVQNFAAAMDQIKRRQGSTYAEMAQKAPQFAEALVGSKTIDEAVSHSLSFLAGIAKEKGPQQARLWAEILFGNGDMANVGMLGPDGLRKLLQDISKNIGTISPEAEKSAKAFKDAMLSMREQATGLRDAIGVEVMPILTELTKSARVFLDENKVSIREGIVGFIKDVRDFDWSGFIGGIKETASSINGFVQSIGGWKNVVIGLAVLKGISIAAPVIGLAVAITKLGLSLTLLPLGPLTAMAGVIGSSAVAAGALGLAVAAGKLAAALTLLGAVVAAGRWISHIRDQTQKHGLHSAPQSPEEGESKARGYRDEIAEIETKLDGLRQRSRDPETFAFANQADIRRLEELRAALQNLEADMAKPKASGSRAEHLRREREELDAELKAAEKNRAGAATVDPLRQKLLALEEDLAKATERGLSEGAERAQPRIERETKSTFERLKDWLSLSSMSGAPAGAGSMIHRASFGGAATGFGGGYGGGGVSGGGYGGGSGYSGGGSSSVPSGGSPSSSGGAGRAGRAGRSGSPAPAAPGWNAAYDAPSGGGIGMPRIALPRVGPAAPASPSALSMKGSTFDQKAPGIIGRLQEDFNLTKDQAAGIVGNLGHESGGFRHMQELRPTVPGSRGGFGWAQWTGPRRRQFEAWSKEKGLDPTSDEANYGFLKHELQTTERKSLAAVRGTDNARDATIAFENAFERSGVKAYGSRLAYSQRALRALERQGSAPGETTGVAWPKDWAAGTKTAGAAPGDGKADGQGFDDARHAAGRKPSPGDLRFKPDPGVDLLRKALRSGVTGDGISTLKGGASLKIELEGFPKGTKTQTQFDGLFKEVQLNRGKSMTMASQDA